MRNKALDIKEWGRELRKGKEIMVSYVTTMWPICSCWSALRYTKLFNEIHVLDEKIEYATLSSITNKDVTFVFVLTNITYVNTKF
jgi:hypothetical protein